MLRELIISFKPCFRWSVPHTKNKHILNETIFRVLNLILAGRFLILKEHVDAETDGVLNLIIAGRFLILMRPCYYAYSERKSFKPCFRWSVPHTSVQ